MKPDERPEAALIRELKEELAIDVTESCLAPLTFASHAYEDFHLLMPLYVCRRWKGVVTSLEGQELQWVKPLKLRDYPMPPADKPLIAHLIDSALSSAFVSGTFRASARRNFARAGLQGLLLAFMGRPGGGPGHFDGGADAAVVIGKFLLID